MIKSPYARNGLFSYDNLNQGFPKLGSTIRFLIMKSYYWTRPYIRTQKSLDMGFYTHTHTQNPKNLGMKPKPNPNFFFIFLKIEWILKMRAFEKDSFKNERIYFWELRIHLKIKYLKRKNIK